MSDYPRPIRLSSDAGPGRSGIRGAAICWIEVPQFALPTGSERKLVVALISGGPVDRQIEQGAVDYLAPLYHQGDVLGIVNIG